MYKVNYTPQSSYNTELYHHGVLGMKWGVRRYQPYGEGGYNPKGKKVSKKEKKRSEKLKEETEKKKVSKTMEEARSKDIDKLTNDELKDYNNRLNLERQFNDLTKEKEVAKKNTSDGKSFVKNAIKNVGTSLISAYGMALGKKIVDAIINKGSGELDLLRTSYELFNEIQELEYSAIDGNDELYHHGVLGMKWGVRRYQPYGEGGYNPKGYSKNTRKIVKKYLDKDGNITQKGKERMALASQYAKKRSEDDMADAESWEEYRKRNSGNTGYINWIKDNYGSMDKKELDYVKKVFGFTNDNDFKQDAKSEARDYARWAKEERDLCIRDGKEWLSKADKYLNMSSFKDLSEDDINNIEKYVEKQLKYLK